MPPRKKQKTASLSPSRRSRTRSASVASAAPPAKEGKRRLVKAEPLDDDQVLQQDSDQKARLLAVWAGDVQPETECWVELPAAPMLEEDRLMFVRPKNKELWKEKGKHKEQFDDSPVLHVDYAPDEYDPFHFSAEDLEDVFSKLAAVKPKAGKKPRKGKLAPASVQADSSATASKPSGTMKPSSLPAAEASGSGAPAQSSSASASASTSEQPSQSKSTADQPTTISAPLLLPEASKIKVQGVTRAAELLSLVPPQTTNGGLEDMFLGKQQASVSNQVGREDGAPLFFESSSDEESKLASQTPAGSQSQRPRVKDSPTHDVKTAKPAPPIGAGGSSARLVSAATSAGNASQKAQKGKKVGERMESEKERMREKRVDRARKKEKRRKQEELKERERQKEKEKQKSAALQAGSDSDDDDDDRGKHRSDDVKNLRSKLNEDAFARSTGVRHKEEFRNKLAKFSQARKKARQERGESISSSSRSSSSSNDDNDVGVRGKRKRPGNGQRATTVSSGSETSGSDSESDDSDDSSSSAESKDFIVADDEIEYDEGFQPDSSSPVRSQPVPVLQRVSGSDRRRFERDSDGRIRLIPISAEPFSGTSGSVLAAHGLSAGGGRKGLDELCFDWLEWAVARVLVTWSALSLPNRERLERNRAALRSRMRSTEESVGSVTMRRQFKWYLTQYPKIDIQPVFRDEVERFGSLAKNGCGICHRKSQKAQFKVTFSGLRYDQHNLAPLKKHRISDSDSGSSSSSSSSESSSDSDSDSDSDSGTESDRSDDNETWREAGEDDAGRPTYTFYAGNHCAQRAAVMHQLHHWEWTTMQTLAKHDSIRYVRRQLWRPSRSGRGKDGRMGAGAYEVALCIEEMISPSGRCTWRGKDKEGKKSSALSELDRLRRRLKSLNVQAIEVNRAR